MIKETGIAIRDILNLEPLKKAKVLAGETGIDRVVNRVNVLADPDILNWVDEGEFLLTTGYFFKTSDMETQLNLIRECSVKKLSGIGIKVYPYLDALPTEIVELANELRFPLIELDYEVAFTDIMTPVFKEIFDKQSNIIRRVETLHKDNMNTMLKGGSVDDILVNLQKSIGNPILVKDHHFEEFIFSERPDTEVNDLLAEDFNQYARRFKTKLRKNKTIRDIAKLPDDQLERAVERLVVPIMVKNAVFGHLVVYSYYQELTNFDVLSVESTASVIALEFLKKMSVQEVENKYKAEFFEDLISFDAKRKNKALDRANYYRFDRDATYGIVTVKLCDDRSADATWHQHLNKAIFLIDSICKDEDQTYLVANKGRNLHILFMWKKGDAPEKITAQITEKIQHILGSKIQGSDFRIGVGRQYEGLDNVDKSLHDAEKAVEASGNYVDERIVYFTELGIYKIFCQDHLKDELVNFYGSTLQPLVKYDRKRDTELVKSLIIYFETNGNLKKMSEQLFTHYNTVLYRINRIQEITGKNLDDEGDRYGLQTALKIMRILDL